MWHSMFVMQIPILEKVLRTVGVYGLILLLFRVVGKRDMAALSTFDFVVMFLLSNVVQNAVIGEDNSLLGGAISAVTLLAVNSVLDRALVIRPRLSRLLEGTPVTIVDQGRVSAAALGRLGLRRSQLQHAVRIQNGNDLGEVETARLEPNGQLLVTLKPSDQSATKADIAELRARLDELQDLLNRRL